MEFLQGEIPLSAAPEIKRIRRACGHETAAHSFPSIFLWQKDLELSLCLGRDAYAVRSRALGEHTWFFPCGEREEAARFVGKILAEDSGAEFLYLREEDRELLEEFFPGHFRIEPAEDASEYLYDRAEYAAMRGGSFQHVRWCVNRLKSRHELRTELLEESNFDTAREMLDRWAPRSESEYFSADHATARMMLDNWSGLDMTGVIVYVDGVAEALAAGFALSERSYDIAFSKALERERGLQFYVRRELIARLPEQYTIINGEEDLGIPGLRQSKLLENPIGRIEMFHAYTQRRGIPD